MGTLWIREYQSLKDVGPNNSPRTAQIAKEPGFDQVVNFGGSPPERTSEAFRASTKYLTMISDVDFHYIVTLTGTVTTDALRIPADTLISIGLPVHNGYKISVVEAA